MKLDDYENEILEADRKEKLKKSKLPKRKLTEYQKAAKETLSKNKRVNIRLSTKDLRELQLKAVEEGIPYQTLMASILHKFLSGALVPVLNTRVQRSGKRK